MNAQARTALDDALPANLEVEQQLLGAMLINNEVCDQVGAFLKPQHFHEPVHRTIYDVISTMHRAGRVASPVTIRDFLPADLAIADMTLGEYIARLAGSATSPLMGRQFGERVRDLAALREMIALGEDISSRARSWDAADSPARQVADAESRLFELGTALQRGANNRTRSAGAVAADIMADLRSENKTRRPTSTGFVDLDHLIGGWRRANLVILAGRPGMMKSTIAGSTSITAAKRGELVHFFSKEMSDEELSARLVTDLAYIDDIDADNPPIEYEDVLNKNVTDERQIDRLTYAAQRLNEIPLMIDPQAGLTLPEITIRARKRAEYAAKKGARSGLIVVDHLGKVRPSDNRRDNRNLELGEITNGLKELAKELDTCVLLLCQLNRLVESRENKRPMLSDLRESGRIEEDADCVLGLYREAYYLSKTRHDDPDKETARQDHLQRVRNDLEVIVLKNRHGAEGIARLWVHPGAGAVRNRARYG